MLKAVQILGSSSGFLSLLLQKSQNSCYGLAFVATSTYPLSCSTSRAHATATTKNCLGSPTFLTGRTRCFRASRVYSTLSESNQDATSSSPVAVQSAGNVRKINFCQWCGGPTKHEIPGGEEKMRAICTDCGKIAYQNPKMVVGCLIEHDKKILLCKRNIEPSHGLWYVFWSFGQNRINQSIPSPTSKELKIRTLPAGYMEIGESAAEGAIRETWEEARAEVEVLSPFAQLDIPLIGQTYIIFLSKLKKPHFSPGPESSECRLFALDEIPFDSLAFSSIFVTLKLFIDDIGTGKLNFHYGTISKRPGSRPSDMRAFSLDNHLQS